MIIEKNDDDVYADEKPAQLRPEPENAHAHAAVPSASASGGSVVAERDLPPPPPYAEGSRPPGTASGDARPSGSRENSVFQPTLQQHVNCVSLYSKRNSISGTYIIDPELPGLVQGLRRRPKKFGMMKTNIVPNAAFETRHGSISLNIATAGGTSVPNKTYVQVGSRHGRINVNLFALQENKHVCLEVHTRHAPIVLLIPPNFQGALYLRTRKGNVTFLPAFAQRGRVVNADDQGAHVLFGTGSLALVEPTSEGLDYCAVSSRHGRLTVGVSGVDQLEAANETSLMKKLGALVLGPEVMRTVEMLKSPQGREQALSHLVARRHQTC